MKKKTSSPKLSLNKKVITLLANPDKVMGGGGEGMDAGIDDSSFKISNYITQCGMVCLSYRLNCYPLPDNN